LSRSWRRAGDGDALEKRRRGADNADMGQAGKKREGGGRSS
jgi:hypothetical protein